MDLVTKTKMNEYGTFEPAKDYLRLDGSTSKRTRHEMVQIFNNLHNRRLRVFLISARAGGQGKKLSS